jgi:DMSO/TMAO reductase YedYZ heme-binding membrane subunit
MLLAAASSGKALWFLTRGTGVVSLLLLTGALVSGIAGTVRMRSPRWPRFLVHGLHRNLTLLAILFVAVHVVTTVADRFAPIGLLDAVVPFRSPYRPVWLGLGAVAFDLLLALVATSLLRARIGARPWRAVHWLAYVSWPVALMHTLGTGSDARTGWLQLLSVASVAAVLGALAWRIGRARAGLGVRAVAAVGALAVPLGLLAWAQQGPLRAGWAARAGTPSTLLPSSRTVAAPAIVPVATREPELPAAPFRATLSGTISNRNEASGLVVVTLDLHAGGAFRGRVHVALRGMPLDGGGVQMVQSAVGVLPRGATAWETASVVALQGQQIELAVRTPSGGTRGVVLDLQIDPASGRVSGVMRSGAALAATTADDGDGRGEGSE